MQEVKDHLLPLLDYLQSSRPTAVNLGEAMDRIRSVLSSSSSSDPSALIKQVQDTCWAVHSEDLARNREMGRLGANWLWDRAQERAARAGTPAPQGLKILTVCNTGSLATSGYGTALGVITALFETDRLQTAYYAQTAPYHQGSRLTSLELSTLKIPACMVCDSMLGSLMQHENLDGVVVGADRIVSNGDTANKVGTYQAAVLAERHNVPFVVVAPVTTVDLSLETGEQITIEQRPAVEATQVRGKNVQTGKVEVVRITPEGVGANEEVWNQVYNPSFDVTPAELISAVVTEKGVAERKEGEKKIDVKSVC